MLYNLFASMGWNALIGYAAVIVFASFLLFLVMPKWIKAMQGEHHRVRDDVPERHQQKQGTPSMGGIPWMVVLMVIWLMLIDWHQPLLWMMMILVLGFMMIGAVDDWGKRHKKDLSARKKALCQLVVALMIWVIASWYGLMPTDIWMPVIGTINVGYGYFIWGIFVLMGSSNASNLTDGLDGLLVGTWLTVVMGMWLCVVFLQPESLMMYHVFFSSMALTGLVFRHYNAHPARIFMGDSASIVLGPMLALIALVLKIEWIFALMAWVMVSETLSVMIQVGSFKLRGKRVFKMAPIHHHFELQGWSEATIVRRFVSASFIGVVVGCGCLYLVLNI
ncbi:MAG: phospho-N-acetylmuramoyl-pentapeptide-transferase [Candidatus Comchoanobacterales bacterium]